MWIRLRKRGIGRTIKREGMLNNKRMINEISKMSVVNEIKLNNICNIFTINYYCFNV